ncbi:MAG: peptidyl-prolyl cis-trans isomerase [Gammaproteobacteria bacterium]|jgi:peptidyl-prolyl cis-trans isomerase B (cyclophilin B)|nr:peptidyl-prolyl cis-trans isomerase [Gammaproteobacteria bacterium]
MRTLLALLMFAALPLAAQESTAQTDESQTATEATENPTVILHTNLGAITVELFEDQAPKSTANFLEYARDGHYDGTIFHRVIDNFMIQGGGFDSDFEQKPTREPIENEADNGLENERGTLAMARTNDPHSATSQFFINVSDNDFLNHRGKMSGRTWGYAVFGRVIDGMDVVDEIRKVETTSKGMHRDVPAEPIVIERVELSE